MRIHDVGVLRYTWTVNTHRHNSASFRINQVCIGIRVFIQILTCNILLRLRVSIYLLFLDFKNPVVKVRVRVRSRVRVRIRIRDKARVRVRVRVQLRVRVKG